MVAHGDPHIPRRSRPGDPPEHLPPFFQYDTALLSQFVEELDLTDLYRTYDRVRKSSATPRQLLKVVLYAAMNRLYSSRDIESACRRDINFMYLLEGAPAPNHATIARFIYLHLAELSESFLAAMSEWLFRHGEISGMDLFIDGTKIVLREQIYLCMEEKGNESVCKTACLRLRHVDLHFRSKKRTRHGLKAGRIMPKACISAL